MCSWARCPPEMATSIVVMSFPLRSSCRSPYERVPSDLGDGALAGDRRMEEVDPRDLVGREVVREHRAPVVDAALGRVAGPHDRGVVLVDADGDGVASGGRLRGGVVGRAEQVLA